MMPINIKINIPNEIIIMEGISGNFFFKISDSQGVEQNIEFENINKYISITNIRCSAETKEECKKFQRTTCTMAFG